MAGFLDFLGPIETIFEKVIPDVNAQMAAKAALQQLAISDQAKELDDKFQLILQQGKVDEAEASNASSWVSGWRPLAGWVCGCGLAYQFLLLPLLTWMSTLSHFAAPPAIDTGSLEALLISMLGLGGLHSFDKVKGVE